MTAGTMTTNHDLVNSFLAYLRPSAQSYDYSPVSHPNRPGAIHAGVHFFLPALGQETRQYANARGAMNSNRASFVSA